MNAIYPLLNFVQIIFLLAWSVFWMTAAIVIRLVTGSAETALSMARRFYSPTLIRAALADFRVEPLPQIDWSKPYIFLMNHQSMLDIICAFAAIPTNLRFVAKHTLKYVPFLGWYMAATGMIFINRSNRRQAVHSLALAGERIRSGASIIAYPEGTRTRDGRILPFKKGPFVLALEAGVPIVPVAIDGSWKVMPRGGFKLRPGLVRLKVGEPIATAGRTDRDQLLREVRDAIVRLNLDVGGAGGVQDSIAAAGVEGSAAAATHAP